MGHEPAVCPTCGIPSRYSLRWDAPWCELCNVWLEPKCAGPIKGEAFDGCYFRCWERPERPLPVKARK